MKVQNSEEMFPHHLHLCNKRRLQELIDEINKQTSTESDQTPQNQQSENVDITRKATTIKTDTEIVQNLEQENPEKEPEQKSKTALKAQIDFKISEQNQKSETSTDNLEKSNDEATTDTQSKDKCQTSPNIESKLQDFWDSYTEEISAWSSLKEQKTKQITKLEVQYQKQSAVIEELRLTLASEQINRHKNEHLLKIIIESNPDLQAEYLSEKESGSIQKTDNEQHQENQLTELDSQVIETDSDEKQQSGYQNEIAALKVKLEQLTSQLETEQDKIAKLQEIVAEYHKEKTKEEKNREVLLEQRSQTGPRSLASRHSSAPLVKTLGGSNDFFEEMFNEPKFLTLSSQMLLGNGFVSSSIGNIKIDNVSQNGNFITFRNASIDSDEDLGMHILQQKLNGKTIASFRFPQRSKLRPGSKVNIWSASANEARNHPPFDYIWKDQYKCAYGLECITVLCKPNGQAVAWYCGQHHYDGNLPEVNDLEMLRRQSRLIPMVETQIGAEMNKKREFIKREHAESRVSVGEVRKHPHGFHYHTNEHPSADTFREKSAGNDQTSLMRQTRLSRTPDLVPELYTGGARTGMRALYRAWEGTPNLVPLKSSAGIIRKMSAAQVAN